MTIGETVSIRGRRQSEECPCPPDIDAWTEQRREGKQCCYAVLFTGSQSGALLPSPDQQKTMSFRCGSRHPAQFRFKRASCQSSACRRNQSQAGAGLTADRWETTGLSSPSLLCVFILHSAQPVCSHEALKKNHAGLYCTDVFHQIGSRTCCHISAAVSL